MIHQPLAGMEGTATELEIHAKEVLRIKQMMNEVLLKHTGQTLTKIEQTPTATISCRPKKPNRTG